MRNTGLDEAQAGIKIARRNINNLRYSEVAIATCILHMQICNNLRYDTIYMREGEEELKSLLMKVKEESEKVVLKLNIQ